MCDFSSRQNLLEAKTGPGITDGSEAGRKFLSRMGTLLEHLSDESVRIPGLRVGEFDLPWLPA
jgi:hypothetical protein